MIDRFLNERGLLTAWPKRQADKELVVGYLATKFVASKVYDEKQVNETLKSWHTFSDWPLLRRELVERGYLKRNKSGSEYELKR